MCDLIKKEDVLKIIDNETQRTCDYLQLDTQINIRFAVEGLSTVEAKPVVHGEWLSIRDKDKKKCSECGVIHLIAQYPRGNANFCPNCGAEMRKKENKCKQD